MTLRPRSNGSRGRLLSAIAATTIWFLGPASSSPVQAEPAFAARTGYSCGQCHVNRTGGGMRTAFGSLYTQTVLPARLLRWREGENLLPANPDARFALGGDLHLAYFAISSDDYEDISSFDIPAANVYGQLRVVPDRLAFYLDQAVGSGASSTRELFGLMSFRTWNGYVKAGKFVPPFGWALPDDDAFIREPNGFAFSTPAIGIEAGFEPGKWSVQMAVVNGNAATFDVDRTKKFTLLTARRFRRMKIGLTAANDISGGTSTTWGGLLGSVSTGRLSLLAEGDFRRRRPDRSIDTWVGYFEANLLIRRGMNLKYVHDWIDPDRCVPMDRRTRDSLGFEYFPYPFLRLRAFVRVRAGPELTPAGSRDEQVDLDIHLYF